MIHAANSCMCIGVFLQHVGCVQSHLLGRATGEVHSGPCVFMAIMGDPAPFYRWHVYIGVERCVLISYPTLWCLLRKYWSNNQCTHSNRFCSLNVERFLNVYLDMFQTVRCWSSVCLKSSAYFLTIVLGRNRKDNFFDLTDEAWAVLFSWSESNMTASGWINPKTKNRIQSTRTQEKLMLLLSLSYSFVPQIKKILGWIIEQIEFGWYVFILHLKDMS